MADKGERAGDNAWGDTLDDAWGDDISDERKAELEARLQAWEQNSDHGEQEGPFDTRQDDPIDEPSLVLTSADVFWLAARTYAGTSKPQAVAAAADWLRPTRIFALDMEHVHLGALNLNGATIRDGVNLSGAFLKEASLSGASLRGVDLSGATLHSVNLASAQLLEADLSKADLGEANLSWAFLIDANLAAATLKQANLSGAYLDAATLSGANLTEANLSGANLVGARLSAETNLTDTILSTETQLADISWNNVSLARIAWETLPTLGDELQAREHRDLKWQANPAAVRLARYQAAVRAYRLLAVALRSQGLNEFADGYAYRAQLMQREVLRWQRKWGQWGVQTTLAVLSGYGYRLWRILAAYGVFLLLFTFMYWLMGVHSFSHEPGWQALWDSFLVSLSAIHGRTMFEQVGAWSPAAWVAAIESVVGIVIEGVFVAMLVQRFFGK